MADALDVAKLRELANEASAKPWSDRELKLALAVEALADEVERVRAERDGIIANGVTLSVPERKRRLTLVGIEHAGYLRGHAAALAAARAALEEWAKAREFSHDDDPYTAARESVTVFDRLAERGPKGGTT
jgi:hypothetical protein